jgi:triosephosphate isomerase (TIM)
MRKKIFAGNWKMHQGPKEATAFVKEFLEFVAPDPHREWVIFPPAVSLSALQNSLKGSFLKYGAQNCHFELKGAFTGEISAPMLKELGCGYAMVGHSERRQLFGETDASCAKKIKTLCESGIVPMLCIGESQKERDEEKTLEVLRRQVSESLSLWDPAHSLVIAYEPVWAIGTGRVATPAQAEEVHLAVRKMLLERFGAQRASEIAILYGGSVKPDNCRELAALPNIDGFLVGGASLAAKSFAQIGEIPL